MLLFDVFADHTLVITANVAINLLAGKRNVRSRAHALGENRIENRSYLGQTIGHVRKASPRVVLHVERFVVRDVEQMGCQRFRGLKVVHVDDRTRIRNKLGERDSLSFDNIARTVVVFLHR